MEKDNSAERNAMAQEIEKTTEHFESEFYKEVQRYTEEIAHRQIVKGAFKYPEPFNPDSWTCQELADHAMEENRDQAVYITGMRDRMIKQENMNKELLKAYARMEKHARILEQRDLLNRREGGRLAELSKLDDFVLAEYGVRFATADHIIGTIEFLNKKLEYAEKAQAKLLSCKRCSRL